MKILLVDDEPVQLELLEMTLSPLGYETLRASDGDLAWKVFELHRPRVIISDWTMPKLSGLDLCRKVREEMRRESGTDYTYFILLTAKELNAANYDRALEMEVDDYLAKPMKESEIRGRLRVAERILRLNRRLQDLETLFPMCAYCKRIRKENGEYEAVESFVHKRSSMTFSHGICPQCRKANFPKVK